MLLALFALLSSAFHIPYACFQIDKVLNVLQNILRCEVKKLHIQGNTTTKHVKFIQKLDYDQLFLQNTHTLLHLTKYNTSPFS